MTTATAEPNAYAAAATGPDADPHAVEDYLFDIRGYRILKGVLSPEQLAAINAWVDARDVDALRPGDGVGDAEVHTYGGGDGVNFQNVIEAGDAFEQLIDHPGWIEQVKRYIAVGAHRLRIDECFLNVRRSGGYIPIHSGGHGVRFTGLFRWHNGRWAVGQINILMALTDIGPGDGATTIVPGSHKAAAAHPQMNWGKGVGGHDAVGMQEVHLEAGDALMFTDALCHGSTARINPGERRVMIYRYAPHLLASRMNYIPSEGLIERLNDARREIVMPMPPRMRPGRTLTAEAFPHHAVGG